MMELNEAITLIDDELFHAIDLLYKEPQDIEVIDKIRNAWAVILNSAAHKPNKVETLIDCLDWTNKIREDAEAGALVLHARKHFETDKI